MLWPDVGGAPNAQAVHQRRDVGIVGAHPYADVDRGVFVWVKPQLSRKVHVLVVRYWVQLCIQDVKQQTRPFGAFVPTIKPAVSKDGVRRDCTRRP